jgi:hypothetical protein
VSSSCFSRTNTWSHVEDAERVPARAATPQPAPPPPVPGKPIYTETIRRLAETSFKCFAPTVSAHPEDTRVLEWNETPLVGDGRLSWLSTDGNPFKVDWVQWEGQGCEKRYWAGVKLDDVRYTVSGWSVK